MVFDKMEYFFSSFEINQPSIYAKFILDNDDCVILSGKTVSSIYFEINRRFPDNLSYKGIMFSGKDAEESKKNTDSFLALVKKYG